MKKISYSNLQQEWCSERRAHYATCKWLTMTSPALTLLWSGEKSQKTDGGRTDIASGDKRPAAKERYVAGARAVLDCKPARVGDIPFLLPPGVYRRWLCPSVCRRFFGFFLQIIVDKTLWRFGGKLSTPVRKPVNTVTYKLSLLQNAIIAPKIMFVWKNHWCFMELLT